MTIVEEPRFAVQLPSGGMQPVANQAEQQWLTRVVERYGEEIRLTVVTDIMELDRILIMELLVHRYGIFLGQGEDYQGKPVDADRLNVEVNKKSLELRGLKKLVGLDKPTRDKARGEGSIYAWIQDVLMRAKGFGVHREKQLDAALEGINELIGMVTFYRNASDAQRREFRHTADDILDWIWDVLRVEYEAIDAHFREHEQKLWIRDQ